MLPLGPTTLAVGGLDRKFLRRRHSAKLPFSSPGEYNTHNGPTTPAKEGETDRPHRASDGKLRGRSKRSSDPSPAGDNEIEVTPAASDVANVISTCGQKTGGQGTELCPSTWGPRALCVHKAQVQRKSTGRKSREEEVVQTETPLIDGLGKVTLGVAKNTMVLKPKQQQNHLEAYENPVCWAPPQSFQFSRSGAEPENLLLVLLSCGPHSESP